MTADGTPRPGWPPPGGNLTHRQFSAAAGQGNNAAVGYHFGTTEDLGRRPNSGEVAERKRLRQATVTAARRRDSQARATT